MYIKTIVNNCVGRPILRTIVFFFFFIVLEYFVDSAENMHSTIIMYSTHNKKLINEDPFG